MVLDLRIVRFDFFIEFRSRLSGELRLFGGLQRESASQTLFHTNEKLSLRYCIHRATLTEQFRKSIFRKFKRIYKKKISYDVNGDTLDLCTFFNLTKVCSSL